MGDLNGHTTTLVFRSSKKLIFAMVCSFPDSRFKVRGHGILNEIWGYVSLCYGSGFLVVQLCGVRGLGV